MPSLLRHIPNKRAALAWGLSATGLLRLVERLADPTGEVRARLGGGEDLLVADIDRETVTRTRRTIPML